MKRLISLVFAGLMTTAAMAQGADAPAEDPLFLRADMADLSTFQGTKRPVLVFANSENDPAFVDGDDEGGGESSTEGARTNVVGLHGGGLQIDLEAGSRHGHGGRGRLSRRR